MLVLTRKEQEEIVVRTPEGREIEFRLVRIFGAKARIGITADRECDVDRREVADRKAESA